MDENNVFLQLLVLNSQDLVRGLMVSAIKGGMLKGSSDRHSLFEDLDKYGLLNVSNDVLVACVLDPAKSTTHTTLQKFELKDNRATRNLIRRKLRMLYHLYYDDQAGVQDQPFLFHRDKQAEISDIIDELGSYVFQLLVDAKKADNPIKRWLEEILLSRHRKNPRHVTIVTNDFTIPWYWMKAVRGQPTLCEKCALGYLQLSSSEVAKTVMDIRDIDRHMPDAYRPHALIVDAARKLQYNTEILEYISDVLTNKLEYGRKSGSRVMEVHKVCNDAELDRTVRNLTHRHKQGVLVDVADQRIEQINRLVHFSGHYGSKRFLSIDDDEDQCLTESKLSSFINDSLLVLDGCNSAHGMGAWIDMRNITSMLMTKYAAMGCLLSVLPVQDDPLISKKFWGEFYTKATETFGETMNTVGFALHQARNELREYLLAIEKQTDCDLPCNPAYLLYQLVGNSTIRLISN
ncbi:hypothetical protein JW859_07925 [bacterium]|nr:hypothetical protein [bacterium]